MFSKPILIALFVSLSFNCLFGYLSYKFYSDKAVIENQLEVAVDANKSLEASFNKKDQACKIADVIAAEYQEENQDIIGKKDQDLRDVDKIISVPKKAINAVKSTKNTDVKATEDSANAQIDVVDIDGHLPDSLVRVLSQNCERVRSRPCIHP